MMCYLCKPTAGGLSWACLKALNLSHHGKCHMILMSCTFFIYIFHELTVIMPVIVIFYLATSGMESSSYVTIC